VSKFTRIAFLLCLLPCVFYCGTPIKADLKGAEVLLERLDERSARRLAGEKSEVESLQQALADFTHNIPSQSADQSGKIWTALLLDSMRIKPLSMSEQLRTFDQLTGQPLSSASVILRLPPPESWPSIVTELNKAAKLAEFNGNPRMGLELLAAALQTDYDKTLAVVAKIIEELSADGIVNQYLLPNFREIESTISLRDGSPDYVISSLKTRLNSLQEWSPEFQLPDLVALVGPEETRQFINSALQLPRVELSIPGGGETLKLAQQIALERADTLKTAQWRLAQTLGSIDLYEALEKRFGASIEADPNPLIDQNTLDMLQLSDSLSGDWERRQARLYYLFSLIAAGREDEALLVANSLGIANSQSFPKQALYDLNRAGYSTQVLNFLRKTLREQPEINLWSVYIDIANLKGIGDEATNTLKEALTKMDIDAKNRATLQQHYADALLASNDINAAVVEYQSIATKLDNREAIETGLKLARVGLLLDDSGVFNIGTGLALERINKGGDSNNWEFSRQVTSLAALYLESAQATHAEGLLFKVIADSIKGGGSGLEVLMMEGSNSHPLLAELMHVYHESGRHEDILILLDGFSMWNVTDLQYIALVEDSQKYPLGFYAAFALAETGERQHAIDIASFIIRHKPGFDPAYELLVDLESEQAIPFLEKIYLTDQFEERPLIWKAIAQSLAGNNEQARETIQKAISIDPTDGEQGRNHRLRAYATLANILDAQGDTEGAQNYRNIVQAVRISELADQLNDAGMKAAAIAAYDEANKLFTDAYCIQARLAIRLTENGRHAEAAEHYRKAYELMPDSFGRVESHCLGCENVFAYPEAASIAEGVFREMLVSRPNDPQVHYLLGYLYAEQKRYPGALDQFRAAVALDPEYLNAWKKLDELGNKTLMAGWERELAIVKMLQLDPMQHHVHPDIQDFLDLKSLYETLAQAELLEASLRSTGPLYPLEASEEIILNQLNALPEEQRSMFELQQKMPEWRYELGRSKSGLLSTRIVASAAILLQRQ